MVWKNQIEPKFRYALFPLALLYWGITFWRNLFYSMGFFVTRKLPAKVISVGNITSGGTGKTPAVIYLAKILLSQGNRVSILSRGYGRKTAGTQVVTDGKTPVTDWRNFGDEPTLMANELTGVPIVVDNNRHRGGMMLVDRFNPDIIIMDDAFQHRAIERDIDIVLINSQDSRATHKLLPYGMLREPWMSLKRADVIIFTKYNLKKPAPFLRSLARRINRPRLKSGYSIGAPKHIKDSNKIMKPEARVMAVAAIGDSEGFARTIKRAGISIVEKMFFMDHYDYTQEDIDQIRDQMKKSNIDAVITTEKDAIKLRGLNLDGINIFSLGIEFVLHPKAEQSLLNIIQN
ncbi:MAG: tetraacyldisaccharide 4'-kinase [Candidatus Marinimicrobia bacterium]|nr:tetraacyldisaccharide 4'-kinase [Candidatus Neomarinimicrobiota bacterium]MDD9887240.1 tetraacyldisaccharide 4'-kinase [Candidatus Neomarinimicrobiota bacterium]MDD9930849.1 tetraacyldisaccharide 4'-kinase [Candidatus Neomarinimicrobiota bacterium]